MGGHRPPATHMALRWFPVPSYHYFQGKSGYPKNMEVISWLYIPLTPRVCALVPLKVGLGRPIWRHTLGNIFIWGRGGHHLGVWN